MTADSGTQAGPARGRDASAARTGSSGHGRAGATTRRTGPAPAGPDPDDLDDPVRAAVATAYAEEWGRVLATLIRLTGDWELAEECVQEAFARALERWPDDGVPERPGAWLTTTARNRAVDVHRRRVREEAKLREAATAAPGGAPADGGVDTDDRLRLIYTCCHPALPLEARVALTLRTLAGLSTAEIARAFLVSERTMGQRLFRARSRIRNAGIGFRVPPPHRLAERTGGVLAVLYLLFNEGYAPTGGPGPVRRELTAEAIRLTRLLVGLAPGEPEPEGLLALMLLHDARHAARTDAAGETVPLDAQDRSRWDHDATAEGLAVLDRALHRRRPGPYQIQAAIAACHATAATAADTDWPQIALLYAELAKHTPGPVVELNRAVAVGMAEGPDAGLRLLDALEGALPGYHLLPAARADHLRRLGRRREAAAAYEAALALASAPADRRFLSRRLAEVGP
ncbi:RNA polymerase sigma factor [Streptomyces sp. NPDC060194]|uniref:RNA polymerase sigma factor n=1 Tax=Streptomyces sp. NPDC060194 TaxID=3347069 RepID=UPI0036580D50